MRRHPALVFLFAALVCVTVVSGALAVADRSRPSGTATLDQETTSALPAPQGTADATSVRPGATPTYAFPIRGCHVHYASTHHDYPAADIFAPRHCAFVSPVAGRVDEVTRTDGWSAEHDDGATRGGISVSVVGTDGVRYYGSHLASVAAGIRPGVPVSAGQLLGRVGDTGSAHGTGTHLHFGISWPTARDHWWVRRGTVPPQPYLDAWKHGRQLSPARAVARAKRSLHGLPRCDRYC